MLYNWIFHYHHLPLLFKLCDIFILINVILIRSEGQPMYGLGWTVLLDCYILNMCRNDDRGAVCEFNMDAVDRRFINSWQRGSPFPNYGTIKFSLSVIITHFSILFNCGMLCFRELLPDGFTFLCFERGCWYLRR